MQVEFLEDRRLLTNTPTDVFAVLEGNVAAPGEVAQFPLAIGDQFQLPRRGAVLGFLVQSNDGLDPDVPQLTDSTGTPLKPRLARADVPESNDSLALYHVQKGSFQLTVGGEAASEGGFQVQAFLPGDLDGDRRVNYVDLLRMIQLSRRRLRIETNSFGFEFPGGEFRNRVNPLDIDANGVVANRDVLHLNSVLRNTNGGGELNSIDSSLLSQPQLYPDPNDDGRLTYLDSLLVISYLRLPSLSFLLEADVNRDGRVTPVDFFFAKDNFHAQIGPPPIDVSVSPKPEQINGEAVTDQQQATVLVKTIPGAEVSLNTDGFEGFNDGTATADAQGHASIEIDLHQGGNILEARAIDGFGQQGFGEAKVRYSPIINRPVTTDPGVQQAPFIAVNPLDPDHVVIAYMDYSLNTTGYAGIGVSVSRDGGVTWQKSSIPVPEPFDQGAADPTVRFDDEGGVYVSYSAATFLGEQKPPLIIPIFSEDFGFDANSGIFVVRSDDGGTNWNTPVAIASHLYVGVNGVPFDLYPEIAIDVFPTLPTDDPDEQPQPNPNYGNIYATWTRLYPPGQYPGKPDFQGSSLIWIAVSRDRGQTWEVKEQMVDGVSTTVLLDPVIEADAPPTGGVFSNPHLTIGPEGDIYVSNFGAGQFTVQNSTDAGSSFTLPNHDTRQGIAFETFAAFIDLNGLLSNRFRTIPKRAIVADSVRPGQVYAVEPIGIFNSVGKLIDSADVFFARSIDHGQRWESDFMVGSNDAEILNDDNDSVSTTGDNANDVIAGQVFSRIAIDTEGVIGVIWYDTRRDPADHNLDVWGTISTDGGKTFSPNFRITNVSFDANNGSFINAVGEEEFYLGDFIGLAMAENTAYAAWTDTRNGNQDVFIAKFTTNPIPEAPNDRFEPNDTPQRDSSPTVLGRVVQRVLPKLTLTAGDDDWFLVEAAATGDLIAQANIDEPENAPPGAIQLELWDPTGSTLLATGDDLINENGAAFGKGLRFPATAGNEFLVRVVGSGNEAVDYSLGLQSLTADLGGLVHADVNGVVAGDGGALYLLRPGASGSLEVTLTAGANVQGELGFQLVDPVTFSELATGETPLGPPGVVASAEPNDAIPQANPTGLDGPGIVTIDGFIGDGDFGTNPDVGDLDYFSLDAGANQVISVIADASGGELNPAILLYDSSGQFLSVGFGAGAGGTQSLTFVTPAADTYFVIIQDAEDPSSNIPDDPFIPGTGHGPGNVGDYRATIKIEALGSPKQASVAVRKDQDILVFISGADAESNGDFSLELTNFDQFSTPENSTLFFPAGDGPSQAALGDLNDDGDIDIVVANALSDTISILLGNGDGTFQSPRQFGIGAFVTPNAVAGGRLPTWRRDVKIADFSGDGIPDVVVTNFDSSDVSLLLGNGDGTFQPQRRFNATAAPFSLDVGDFDGNGVSDVATVDSTTVAAINGAVLLGRDSGTFQPQRTFQVQSTSDNLPFSTVRSADLNKDGNDDLVVSGSGQRELTILLSNGDGTFLSAGNFAAGRLAASVAIGDVNNDGNLDIVTTSADDNHKVSLLFGNGNGAFQAPQEFFVGQTSVAVEIADFASPGQGAADGLPDLVVAVSGAVFAGKAVSGPQVVVLPGVFDEQESFIRFDPPQPLADVDAPINIDVADVNNDGLTDIVVVDREGVLVIFGQPPVIAPNNTPQTARDLGAVVHLVQPTLSIIPGHEDAFFNLTVPTEALPGAGDEVIDFSGLFEATAGAGLSMEVMDSAGNVLGAGERFRVTAAQGGELTLHVFGVEAADGTRGFGAYTLVIDVLPQVVSMESQPLLPGAGAAPGGPTASIVVALQGDRLDPMTAENTDHYIVTHFGADNTPDTADDEVIPVTEVVYNPSVNVDVTSGLTFPTAIKQTINLLFENPLLAGSYRVELSDNIQTAPFNDQELDLLANTAQFGGHPIVQRTDGNVMPGAVAEAVDLVIEAGALGDFTEFLDGTAFLSQLHNDLGAILDAALTERGDDLAITEELIDQVLARFDPALGEIGARPASMLVLILDPVSIVLTDPMGDEVVYDQQDGSLRNDFDDVFVEVGGNVEVIVIPNPDPEYQLTVFDVPELPRGAYVILTPDLNTSESLTEDLRNDVLEFPIAVP